MIVDQHTLRAVDLLTGHVDDYDCHTLECPGNVSLSALSVNHDGVIYVTDVNNANVYTVTSQLPAPHNVTGNYDVMDPTTQQRYVFNRLVDICHVSLDLSFNDIKLLRLTQMVTSNYVLRSMTAKGDITLSKLRTQSRVYTRATCCTATCVLLPSTCCLYIGNKIVTSLLTVCCWIQRDTSRP